MVLNNAFYPYVADRDDPNRLLVLPRFNGGITSVFLKAKVIETPVADYRFCAFLPRSVASARLSGAANPIDHPNVKNFVFEQWRYDFYLKMGQILYSV